jgi:hypothetical protein
MVATRYDSDVILLREIEGNRTEISYRLLNPNSLILFSSNYGFSPQHPSYVRFPLLPVLKHRCLLSWPSIKEISDLLCNNNKPPLLFDRTTIANPFPESESSAEPQERISPGSSCNTG